MKYCKNCILSEHFYSVKIDENGLCNYCSSEAENKQIFHPEDTGLTPSKKYYDIILAYSGGKDSTYTLYLLKEKYNLNVLAITFDNGFLSEETYKNIKNVCNSLDVDSEIIAPSTQKLNPIFQYALEDDTLPKKSLERASAICTYCIALVKMNVYKEAILRKIPFIAFGWTPGQINIKKQVVKLEPSMLKTNFSKIRKNIVSNFGDEFNSILLTDELIDSNVDAIPSLFYPFVEERYNEQNLLNKIAEFGWQKPKKTDSNSTNCLLNTYAIYKHKEKYGFHPYALELAQLVRSGLMDRKEALDRITEPDDLNLVKKVESKLNGLY